MKKILKFYVPGLILIILLILLVQPNPYFRRAIYYNTADITDYKIFDNRTIDTGQPQEWNISVDYNKYSLSSKELDFLRSYETVAFLIVKDTSLLFETYWDEYSESSMSNSFSMAKSIVSLLVGIAIDEGKIGSVDDPLTKYIPEYINDKNSNIKIRDLLTMSSGIEWNESYINPFSVTTKAYYGNNLNSIVLNAKAKEQPGVKFDYITANPQLLSMILKKVTGMPLAEYASEKLWKPLGAEHIASWSLDKEGGDEKAYCCFNSNARDFARIGQLILNKGKWNGRKIISKEYVEKALTPASNLVNEEGQHVDFYGYQWWLSNYKDLQISYARGILGQYIIVIPSKNIVIVRLGHKRDKTKINHHPLDFYKYINLSLKISNNNL